MSNLFNPIQAASDYKAGLISKRGLIIRKTVLVLFLLTFTVGVLIPSTNPTYDIVSTIGFLSLYLGIPFYLKKKMTEKISSPALLWCIHLYLLTL